MKGRLYPYRAPTSGELIHRVQVRTRQDIPVENFGLRAIYTPRFTTWGKLMPVGEGIRIGSVQIHHAITHRLVIRTRPGISQQEEVVIEGRVYRIKGVTAFQGERHFLVISLEELGNVDKTK